jgi:uncharacterized membrane protein
VISGYYADANSHYHGFVYESGTFTQIDYPGATGTQAMSINNTGIVVGSFWDPTGRSHGFRLRNGLFARIDGPDAVHTAVLGINNSNAVVGYYIENSGAQTGFEKKEGGDLLPSGSELTGINDLDAKVGFFMYGSGIVAFHLRANTLWTFGCPGATSTLPHGTNNATAIVGTYTDSQNIAHAFLHK